MVLRIGDEQRQGKPLPLKPLLVIVVLLLVEPFTNSIIRSFDNAPSSSPVDGIPGQNSTISEAPEELQDYSQFLVGLHF